MLHYVVLEYTVFLIRPLFSVFISGGANKNEKCCLGTRLAQFLTGNDPGKARSKKATSSFTASYEPLDRPPENIFTAALMGACTSKPIAGIHLDIL